MAKSNGLLRKRIHVSEGVLVASTNIKQHVCCRDLIIIHKYRCNSYKRISRYVQHSNTINNENIKKK